MLCGLLVVGLSQTCMGQEVAAPASSGDVSVEVSAAGKSGSPNADPAGRDLVADLQAAAVKSNRAEWGYWGTDPAKYTTWKTHTNRLIPIYTFGIGLSEHTGENSVYRSAERLQKLFGYLPERTVKQDANYMDQTDVYRLQKEAIASGKKRVVLFVFDGMDWQTTQAAAIAKTGSVTYTEGRGSGLAFQDYANVATDFGSMVTSPHNNGTSTNVDRQIVTSVGGKTRGGYDATLCGDTPWSTAPDIKYPIGQSDVQKHAYTDSASSATSMTAGIKTYNSAINVDFSGREVLPIAREIQTEGFAVGVVTSVPVSHATPACGYANNVNRNDYQDLTRDMLGQPSIFHPGGLSGLDVLVGGGWGESKDRDGGQGKNFVSGNRYLAPEDLEAISIANGGKYVVAERTKGKRGAEVLEQAVGDAIAGQHRLFGFFGVGGGHLPFQTADGGFNPVDSTDGKAEVYTENDLNENVTLAEMALAAIRVLNAKSDHWWLMVEAGDVDWANHSNNIDNSIGAVLSGDEAFRSVTEWIEQNGGWEDTAVIVTADHGHYFVLNQPEALVDNASSPQ